MKSTPISLAALAIALVLGGCLSQENSNPVSGGGPVGESPQPNHAPSIGGSPAAAVTIGESYTFTPTASDSDGDTLTFSVSNLPSWASFDAMTGTLTGTPTLGDIGTYADITISVSDGSLTDSMTPFPIDVVQAALGSVTLSWTPPTENSDGSLLNDLVAYKFYYGTKSGQYTSSIRVDSPGIATYVIDNLVPNTYYFVATAVNSTGMESAYSNEISKAVMPN